MTSAPMRRNDKEIVDRARAIMRKYWGRDDWELSAKLATTAAVRIDLEAVVGKRSPAAG